MQINEVKSILKTIDLVYNTEYENSKDMVEHYYKYLKEYDNEDINLRLSNYIQSSEKFPPKVYDLIHGLLTLKDKETLKGIREQCPYCKNLIKTEEFKEHYENCMDIDYIKRSAKKYLNQDIDLLKYYSMTRSEVLEKVDQMMKIVYQKTENKFEKNCLKKYFETKEQQN